MRFEGVYMDSSLSLYVNCQLAGVWKYGYSTFELDITPYIQKGPNGIQVRVVHQSPNSRCSVSKARKCLPLFFAEKSV
nr:sugar-binding domain-containing protein [Paenibacillus faecis]